LFSGFIILTKPSFLRKQIYKYYESKDVYFFFQSFKRSESKLKETYSLYSNKSKLLNFFSIKTFFNNFNETIWYFFNNENFLKKSKTTFVVQSNNATLTMSG